NLRGNVLAVDRLLQSSVGHGDPALAADFLDGKENALLQSWWPVEENVVPNCILVVNAKSGSNRRLPILPRIPRQPDLRPEVFVWLRSEEHTSELQSP